MSSINILMSASGGSAPSDPYFENVTMLLPADGTNGAQNNTFLDSSSNNFTITRNGNTTQGTFTPYGSLWSNYFDGSGDYLSNNGASGAFAFGTGAFTIEFWMYASSATARQGLYTNNTASAGTGPVFAITGGGTTGVLGLGNVGSADSVQTGSNAFSANTWHHVALVREGTGSNQTKIYVDGVQKAAGTYADNLSTSREINIGATYYYGEYFGGYISNLRVVKGTAVYTTAFTPPTTPLTAITNTSLLTCQSNRFIDNSTNAFAITANGNVAVQRFSPFNPTAAYSTATIGGSGYFDGSGDYLTTPSNAAFSYGTGDFSQEFWIYLNTSPSTFQRPFQYSDDRDNIIVESGNFNFYDGTASTISAATTGQWFHLCVTRVGGTLRGFVNGKLGFTRSGSYNSSTRSLALGATSGGANPLGGYTTNCRIVKGGIPSAYSTSSTTVGAQIFTPPTAPFTGSESLTAGSVSLLCNMTNAGIYDNAMMNDLETVGNAQISTSVKKYGTGSIAFDGNGDWLVAPTTPNCSFETGDFTIEGWVYPSAVTGTDRCLWDTRASSADAGMVLFINSTGNLSTYTSNALRLTSTGTLTANTWQHIALVRSNGTMAFYINGTQSGTLSYSTAITCPGRVWIGARFDAAAPYTGYIDDLRITKGVARYTSNFTAPTEAFPLY